MGRARFVVPDVVRLPLSEGDWIDVKKELNAGEQRRVFTGLVKSMQAGEPAVLNPEQVGKTKILEYVVGWSFVDADNRPVEFTEGALDAVDPDTYVEIMKAVDAHDEAAEKVRAERKNAKDGAIVSSAISPSVGS